MPSAELSAVSHSRTFPREARLLDGRAYNTVFGGNRRFADRFWTVLVHRAALPGTGADRAIDASQESRPDGRPESCVEDRLESRLESQPEGRPESRPESRLESRAGTGQADLAATLPIARLGLAVAKKRARRAVDRNRIKRAARESFRHKRDELCGHDIVVMNRDAATTATAGELRAALDGLLAKVIRQAPIRHEKPRAARGKPPGRGASTHGAAARSELPMRDR